MSFRGNNTVANATRSLPDLPVDSGDASEKLWSNAENNADTSSDLYATVDGNKLYTTHNAMNISIASLIF